MENMEPTSNPSDVKAEIAPLRSRQRNRRRWLPAWILLLVAVSVAIYFIVDYGVTKSEEKQAAFAGSSEGQPEGDGDDPAATMTAAPVNGGSTDTNIDGSDDNNISSNINSNNSNINDSNSNSNATTNNATTNPSSSTVNATTTNPTSNSTANSSNETISNATTDNTTTNPPSSISNVTTNATATSSSNNTSNNGANGNSSNVCDTLYACQTDHMDRMGHETPLYAGQALCNDNYRFGVTPDGIFQWHNCSLPETKVIYDPHSDTSAAALQSSDVSYFSMSSQGILRLYDNQDQVIWQKEPTLTISFSAQCLRSPLLDCPYLHLHKSGDVVLNSITIDGQWSNRKIQKCFDDLFH